MRRQVPHISSWVAVEESGAVTVIVVLCMAMLTACLALVIDLGSSYVRKVQLQTAVDNAALAAGALLPVESNASNRARVQREAEDYLEANGVSIDDDGVSFTWGGNGTYDYQLRITVKSNVSYSFATLIGRESGEVGATASVSAKPIGSTFKAISVYIRQSDFEAQAASLNADAPFTITISSSGSVSTSSSYMGVMRIVSESDRSNYATFEGITTARDREFFETGYYGMTSTGAKVGLSVGDSRIIENNSSIYLNAYTGMLARISSCASECGSGCSHTSHSNSCPRIALLPVVSVSGSATSSSSSGGRGGQSSSSSYAAVKYFVAIYIQSVTKTSSATTITAYYLNDYREVSDVDESSVVDINEFTVCTPVLSE